jgi:hypothetical protein
MELLLLLLLPFPLWLGSTKGLWGLCSPPSPSGLASCMG